MDFITHVQQGMEAALPQIIADYEGEISAASLREMEQEVNEKMQQVGRTVLATWLESQREPYPAETVNCACGAAAEYKRQRKGTAITLQGRVNYRRAYYLWANCGAGQYPLDERLGIQPGQMSETVKSTAALLGIQVSFEISADLLERLVRLELSPQSIRKASQTMGERVMTQEAAQKAHSQDLAAQLARKRAPQRPQRLYGSLDGFHVPLEDGWHEMKAGAWWTTDEENRATNITYYTDLLPAAEFSELVWATGFTRHADQAVELVFVADAAAWIWRIVEEHFPHAVQIVDWYHACAYLTPVAQLAADTPAERQDWLEQVKEDLWQGRLDDVIAACGQHIQNTDAPEDDPAYTAVRYYTNNRQRLDYPTYRDQGYQIGSGTMESACKQIGLERLKLSGARWTHEGARKVAKARAAYLSGQWDTLAQVA
jgi:hypothetical protein